MVFVFELGDDDSPAQPYDVKHLHNALLRDSSASSGPNSTTESRSSSEQDRRPYASYYAFATALNCYPIASSLASLLDLNSLHNLSRTCRQFRAILLLYRDQLVKKTLRCENEDEHPGDALAARLRESRDRWRFSDNGFPYGRITSGRVARCARDLVAECRRCGTVVCRNCTAKPPPPPALPGRHRRLCRTCISAPLDLHLSAAIQTCTPKSSPQASPARLYRIPTPNYQESPTLSSTAKTPRPFTHYAFRRTPCLCKDFYVWLCTTCGNTLRASDTTYSRGWTWRSKYSHLLGGLGTGIAEGNKGVECGRRASCLAARLVEQEEECDAEELAAMEEEAEKVAAEGTGRSWSGGGFAAQEMEGVGGLVRMKVKRMVRVGAEVDECDEGEEEGAAGKASSLDPEKRGEVRSWCAWCERIIPATNETWEEEWNLGGS